MALYLCKFNSNSYIIDRKYGFDVVSKVDNSCDNNLKVN